MRRVTAAAALICWGMLAPLVVFGQGDELRLLEATPSVTGELVVCRLAIRGLPGEKQLQTMRSGLESAVELNLAVVDEDDQVLGGNSISLRMGFDLWDEVFSVRGAGQERRFQTLNELQSYLADLNELPVDHTSLLGALGTYRLRIGMVVHAIAPDEQKRVADVISGRQGSRREGQDEQEASVSLGRLIGFFYKGSGKGKGDHEIVTAGFTLKELTRGTH